MTGTALAACLVLPGLGSPAWATLNQPGTGSDTSVAWGKGSQATKTGTIAIGAAAKAAVQDDIAIGTSSNATGNQSIAIGREANATGSIAITIGYNTLASGQGAVAISHNAKAKKSGAIAIGENSIGSDEDSTALGSNSKAAAKNSIALGPDSLAGATESIALGYQSQAMATYSTSLGYRSQANGSHSIAMGSYSLAKGLFSTALGRSSKAEEDYSTALGYDAKSSVAKAVALGAQSVANRGAFVTEVVAPFSGEKLNADNTLGAVSVGNAGKKRQIINVADATKATDAVNLRQLKGLDDFVVKYDKDADGNKLNIVTLKGGDPNAAVAIKNVAAGSDDTDAVNVSQLNTAISGSQLHYLSVNDGGTQGGNYNNDGATARGAVAIGVDAQAEGVNSFALGREAKALIDSAIAVGYQANIDGESDNGTAIGTVSAIENSSYGTALGDSSRVIKSAYGTALGAGATVDGADGALYGVALGASSLADRSGNVAGYDPRTGGASTDDSLEWKSIYGAVSVGNSQSAGAKASRQIINVAAGSEDSDAVNVAQLKALKGTVDENKIHYFSVNDGGVQQGNYNNDGAVSSNSLAIGPRALAQESMSLSLGMNNKAMGINSSAVGNKNETYGANSSAFGENNKAGHMVSLVASDVGQAHPQYNHYYKRDLKTLITEEDLQDRPQYLPRRPFEHLVMSAVAIGSGNKALYGYSTAVGSGNTAYGWDSQAVGRNNVAGEQKRLLRGHLGTVNLEYNRYYGLLDTHVITEDDINMRGTYIPFRSGMTAMGYDNEALYSDGTAIGRGNKALAYQAVSMGRSNTAYGRDSMAVGASNQIGEHKKITDADVGEVVAAYNTHWGWPTDHEVTAEDVKERAGYNDQSSGASSVAFGNRNIVTGARSDAFGIANSITKTNSTAVGIGNRVYSDYSITVGRDNQTGTPEKNVTSAVALGTRNIVLGNYSAATGHSNVVGGNAANVVGTRNIVGTTSSNALVFGHQGKVGATGATVSNAGAITFDGETNASNAVAIGFNTFVSAQNTVAIGYNSKATVLDGVALGTGSEGTVAAGVVGYDPVKNGSSQNHTPTWKATKGAVSVGKADGSVTRQITGLAAGFNDTDAVNVAQLKGLDDVAVKYDLDSNGNKLNTVTLKGGNMTQPVTIKNVAVGTENTDAVNVSQLNTAIAGSKTHYYSVKSDVTGPGSNYDNDGATGRNALAAGVAAKAPGDGGVAVGFGATSQNTGAIAIGSKLSIAVGDSGAQATSLSSIAIGSNTKATGWGSIAIGSKMAGEIGTTEGALASAGSAVAIGAGTIAQGPSSVSLGQLAKNTRDYGIAIGSEASVESANSIAIGRKASVPAMYNISAVAIGDTALAANRSVALGASAQATGSYSLAIGGGNSNTSNTKATATEAIAIGVNALPGTPTSTEATGQQSIAIGKGAQAAAERSVAFGTRTKASGAQSTAIGADAVASDTNALSLGTKAQATKAAAIAIGLNSSATHEGAVALANGAQSSGQYSLALGVLSNAAGSYSVALGREASVLATAMNGMALGRQASVSGRHGIAMGYVASATANSIAIGVQSKTTDNQGISIGTQAQTGAVNAIAMGTGAQALGSGSIAIGRGNVVRGANSGAFGDPSIINGANSYSVGNNNTIGSTTQNAFALGNNIYLGATATGEDTIGVSGAIALGNNAFVDKAGGVALGEESRATTAAGEAGYDPATGGASKVGDSTWQSTHAAVSVGDGTTATRQITGVAAGSVDTDAVNVAQLKAVGEMAQNANQGFNIAANSSVDDVVDTRIEPGETLTVQGTGEGEFAAYDSDNIQTQVSADNTITIGLKKDLNVTSVTTGNTTINNDGLTIEGGPSVTTDGIAAGGKRITDVAAGVEATDAVNMSQLEAVAGEAGKHSSVSAGTNMVVTSGVNADGGTDYTVATAPDVAFDSVSINNGGPTLNSSGINMNSQKITGLAAGDISGTSTDAVNGSQLYNTAHTLRTEGMNFSVNVGSNVHRDLGQTLAIRGQGSTAGSYSGANVRTVSDPASGAINLQIADAPVFSGQVSAPTYVATGANPIVVSGDSGTINGLSNRTFDPGSYTSGQAATEDQLAQVDGKVSAGWNITANGKNPSNVGPGQTVDFRNTDGNIRIGKAGNNLTFNLNPNLRLSSVTTGDTRINTNGLFIKGGPSVTKAGIDAAGLQVTNVADGLAPYDAVNRGQLDALDHRLSREIDKVDDRASAGIASAMAAASVPQATIPGANLLGAGTGYYNGHSALSIGYSAMSDNGRWIIRSNFSVNSEDAAVSAGIGYQW